MTKTATPARRRAPAPATNSLTPTSAARGKPATPNGPTKLELIITALRSADGATIEAMAALTGWQT